MQHDDKKVHDAPFVSIWSDFLTALEPHVTVICISLPTLGPILQRFMCKGGSPAASDCTSSRELSACSGRTPAHRDEDISMLELCRQGRAYREGRAHPSEDISMLELCRQGRAYREGGYRTDARSESGSEAALAPPIKGTK